MDIKKIRCDLHQIPELGRKEYKTKEYILSIAKNYNCQIYEPTNTAVVLYFNANKKNTICLRSDMDALPIKELNNVEYKSLNEGVMHACGHDGHMAMLLGACDYINTHIDLLENNVVCLFQPSEEDDAGANDILKSNILSKLNVSKIFGMHIWPNLEMNKLYSMPNGMLATSAEVTIDITGKSTHAANKSQGIDALYAGTTLINEFYKYESTVKDPHLVNFGVINSGTARNIVSDKCHIEATMRAYEDDVFNNLKNHLLSLISDIQAKMNCKIDININAAYPSVLNNEKLFNEMYKYLNLTKLNHPFLQAEDFGCYTRKFECLFMLLGCGNDRLLHQATFDFNMDILNTGVEAYKKIVTYKFI